MNGFNITVPNLVLEENLVLNDEQLYTSDEVDLTAVDHLQEKSHAQQGQVNYG